MNIIRQIKLTANRLSSLLIKKDSDCVVFDCFNFEITKREIIMSLVIFAFFMSLGFIFSEKIAADVEDSRRMYNQALQVDSKSMFEYGMATNVGNAFVYGDLKAVDTVTYDEIGGQWLWIEKEREEYTRHEREVEHTDSDGNTYYTTEVYYTWDYDGSEKKHSQKITFLDVQFDYGQIEGMKTEYIDTIYQSMDVRYNYRGSKTEHTGTIFTKLENGTIENNVLFYEDKTIEQVLDAKTSSCAVVIFWIFWICLMIAAIFGFYYLDNTWLD